MPRAANHPRRQDAITATNNQGLWFLSNLAAPGSAQLIAQGGMVAPNEGGATFGNSFSATIMNGSDTIVFKNTLSNGLAA